MSERWDVGQSLMRRLFYWSTAVHLVLFAIVAVVAKIEPAPFVKKSKPIQVVRVRQTPAPTQRVTPRPATPKPTNTPKPTPTKPPKTPTPKPKTPEPTPRKTATPRPTKKTVSRKTEPPKTPTPKTPTPPKKTPTPWEPPVPPEERKTPPIVTPPLRTPPVVTTPPPPVKTPDTPFDLQSDAALLDEWYLEQARARIKAFFRYPTRYNKVGLGCDLSFTVARDGTISNITIRKSSGNGVLDGYAEKALRDAERLPPLPETVTRSPLRLTVTFDFSGLDNP